MKQKSSECFRAFFAASGVLEYNGLSERPEEDTMDYEHHIQIKIILNDGEEERLKEFTQAYKDRVKHPVTEDYVLQRMIEAYLTRRLAPPKE